MWHIDLYGILMHPTESKVWVRQENGSRYLPGYTHSQPTQPWLQNQYAGAWLPGLQDALGCEVYILKNLKTSEDSERRRASVVCLLEVKHGQPRSGEWVALDSADLTSFSVPEHGDLVRDTVEALVADPDEAKKRPSECRGWHGEVVVWIEQQLSEQGYEVDRIEQMRSAILRAHTDRGAFYFKAIIDPWYTNEPVIADTLGTHYPHLVPRPISIDSDRQWMLTAAFGETLEDPERDRELLVKAVQSHAQMQKDSTTKLDELRISDTHGFDMDQLPKTVEAYIREGSVVKSLEPEESSALEGYLPTINDYIEQLVNSPIPQTIVHGDLGPYNIAQRDGEPVVFDWSTVGVSFPFFDMVEFEHRIRLVGGTSGQPERERLQASIRSEVRQSYLSVWTDLAPMSELERLWKVVEPMGYLSMGLHLPFPAFPRYVLRFLEDSEAE